MKNVLLLILIGFVGIVSAQKAVKAPVIKVDNFEAKAGKYVDKKVYLTGLCDHVCKHAGKKIHLVGKNDAMVEIMAGDIEKFPKELEGEDLKVLCTVMEERIDAKYLDEWEKEVKQNHGEGTEECKNNVAEINKYRDQLKNSKKGYVPSYYAEAISYEKI